MSKRGRQLWHLGLLWLVAGCLPDADTPKQDKSSEDKRTVIAKEASTKPATVKVERGPLKVETSMKGVIEAESMTEITLADLEAWTPMSGGTLVVKRVLPHGSKILQGEPVLWLDTEKLDKAIRDLEADQELAALAIKLAKEELPLLEKSWPVELAAAERAKKIADENLQRYKELDRKLMEESANWSVKSAASLLENEREELRQLEKMYKSKDLTEETEEIILKRQRFYVEMAEYFYKRAVISHDETLKLLLPRQDELMKENAVKASLALQRAQATLPLTVSQKRLALAKMEYDHEKSTTRLSQLRKDRERMVVKAPTDGLLYHGRCNRGQWQGSPDRLQRGAMVQGEEVLLTVVKPRPYFVRAVVEEKDLGSLRPGMACKVVPTGFPDLRLPARIESVGTVPITPGNFEARVSVEPADGLMPGMGCNVKVAPYVREDALTLPANAVFAEELDEDKHYVWVPGKDGKGEKRPITAGKKVANKIEILSGLAEGDEVLQDKPKPDDKPATPRKEAGK